MHARPSVRSLGGSVCFLVTFQAANSRNTSLSATAAELTTTLTAATEQHTTATAQRTEAEARHSAWLAEQGYGSMVDEYGTQKTTATCHRVSQPASKASSDSVSSPFAEGERARRVLAVVLPLQRGTLCTAPRRGMYSTKTVYWLAY